MVSNFLKQWFYINLVLVLTVQASLLKSLDPAESGLCLRYTGVRSIVTAVACDHSDAQQHWTVERSNPDYRKGLAVRQFIKSEFNANQCLDISSQEFGKDPEPWTVSAYDCNIDNSSNFNQYFHVAEDDTARVQYFKAIQTTPPVSSVINLISASNRFGGYVETPQRILKSLYLVSDIYDLEYTIVGFELNLNWKCDEPRDTHRVEIRDNSSGTILYNQVLSVGVRADTIQISTLTSTTRTIRVKILNDNNSAFRYRIPNSFVVAAIPTDPPTTSPEPSPTTSPTKNPTTQAPTKSPLTDGATFPPTSSPTSVSIEEPDRATESPTTDSNSAEVKSAVVGTAVGSAAVFLLTGGLFFYIQRKRTVLKRRDNTMSYLRYNGKSPPPSGHHGKHLMSPTISINKDAMAFVNTKHTSAFSSMLQRLRKSDSVERDATSGARNKPLAQRDTLQPEMHRRSKINRPSTKYFHKFIHATKHILEKPVDPELGDSHAGPSVRVESFTSLSPHI